MIPFSLSVLPYVRNSSFVTAETPFLHQDRRLSFYVILYLQEGFMQVTEEHKSYVLKPGDVFLLRKDVHHWGETPIPSGTRWYFCHFYAKTPAPDEKDAAGRIPYIKNQEFLPKDYSYYICLKQHYSMAPASIQRLFQELNAMYHSASPLRNSHLSLKLMELLLTLYESDWEQKKTKSDITIQKLVDYMEETVGTPFDSEAIASHMNMNYHYLTSLFREKTGYPIHQYHTRLRINEACRLLRETSMNISEVSDAMGFSDPLYFSTVFKKMTGSSPSCYRISASGI